GPAGERGRGDGRIVDDPVPDHLGHVGPDRDGVGRDLGEFPGELLFAGQVLTGGVCANAMRDHSVSPCGASVFQVSRARLLAATNAARSMNAMAAPPNRVPRWFSCAVATAARSLPP